MPTGCYGWYCNPDSPCCTELNAIKKQEEQRIADLRETASHSDPSIFETMGMDMVTVELEGKDGDSKRFPIYKELLCRDSKFFKAALTGGFSEAHRGVVKVKDTPEKTFRAFIQWLFTKDFVKTGYEEVIDYPLHELLDLFIFADFYDVPELRALVLERCARMTFDWTPEAVTRAYDRVPEDSEFIKKMVKRALWNWHPDAFEEEKDLYPPQFVWDVMARSLKNRKNWPEPSVLDDNVY